MPLSPNSKLGPYEIKSSLGVGGMGEVYRARDSRLNRDVAIKVLRQDSASGSSGASADLRSRFEREARAVAALNHPNIIAVYDFGIEAGQQYIVSELLEGESLRLLLKGKPLPVRRLIEVAAQVADGLAAAHTAGIVHRDLKPENIMLTKDGRAKILDFGLARQSRTTGLPRRETGEEETVAPPADETKHLTSEGAVLGTASYMSPEQALGKEVDYRSDQFSFGLILHEMASGKQAFARSSSVETMAAIVRDEPSVIEEKIPAPLKWIIDRCLAKEPEQRYESTRDLYRDLKNLRDHFSEAYSTLPLPPTPFVHPESRSKWLPVALAAGISLGGVLAYLLVPRGQNIANYRYTPLASEVYNAVWSPDGKAIAFDSEVDGVHQVFLRYLNSPVPTQLTREKRDMAPLGWSSDKGHILVNESPLSESELPELYSIATVGGDLELIGKFACFSCAISPDGKALATMTRDTDGYYGVRISDPIGAPLKNYAPAPFATRDIFFGSQMSFSPDGKTILLFFYGRDDKPEAWLLPYPAGSSPPRRVFQKVLTLETSAFSWMPDSRHLVATFSVGQDAPSHLWMVDTKSDSMLPLTTGTDDELNPSVAPDGKSLIYNRGTGTLDVVSVSLADGAAETLIKTGRIEMMPSWAVSQKKLAWVTNRNGPFEIWIRSADGSVRPAVTAAEFATKNKWFVAPALSPDGGRIAYERIDASGVDRLWMSSVDGGSPVRLTNVEPSSEFSGSWSPDGSRFVYLQGDAGRLSLMMVKAVGNAKPTVLRERVQVGLPSWSPSGEWITFRDDKGWNLISPAGDRMKSLGQIDTDQLTFSRDGKLLYGIGPGERPYLTSTVATSQMEETALFSLDPVTLEQKIIRKLGNELQPVSPRVLGIRLSLAPDGKSVVYSTAKYRSDLWMLTGYRQPGLWNQIKDTLHFSPAK
jgi:eukaryotic-like serine/threonine-protein kinase